MEMIGFIKVDASGDWDDNIQDYIFEEVDAQTFFNISRIEWYQVKEDYVIFGVIGYETVFRTSTKIFAEAIF